MTKQEQRLFVRELIERCERELLLKVDSAGFPAHWDGFELRRWIAEKFQAQTLPLGMRQARRYNNEVLTRNLL